MPINESSYRQLCDVCDRVFLETDTDDYLVAIPFLHIIRAHPVLLKKYTFLFNNRRAQLTTRLRQWGARLIFTLSRTAGFFQGGATPVINAFSSAGPVTEKLDFLFVSHFLNPAQREQADDFYFGDLPRALTRAGFRVGIAHINQSHLSPKELAEGWMTDGISRFFLGSGLPGDERKELIHGMVAKSARLAKLARKYKHEKAFAGFCRAAAVDARSGTTILNLELARNFRKLLGYVSPRVVLFTHEGHAWERLFCAQAKRHDDKTVTAGYIHAALFSTQHSLLRKLPPEYCPDHVFTTGEIGLEFLREKNYYLAEATRILGSHKVNSYSTAPDNKQSVCLVLPEGLAEECHFLFSYCMRVARLYPGIRFVWRLHPVVTFEALLKKYPEFRKLPDNISLSSQAFEEDLGIAKWAMYRGSTAIVQALAAGVMPLYISRPGEINLDPLHQLTVWKKSINDKLELAAVFADTPARQMANCRDFEQAMDFSRRFYHSLDYTLLENCLPA